MNRGTMGIAVLAATVGMASLAAAALVIYPAKGQSEERQEKDLAECNRWATKNTGFDPANPPARPAPPAPPAAVPRPNAQGQVVGGAAKGAALGAVGGAIGGSAGKGAAIGAAVGGTHGAMKRAGARRRAEVAAYQQSIDYQNEVTQENAQYERMIRDKRTQWDKNVAACMEGRGYTVK